MIVQGRDISYTLLKVLGKGAYGVTHLAQGSDGQKYAIKKYKGRSLKARKERDFEEEMLKTVLGICKDHTVCFVESINNNQGMFIVMELLEGMSVHDAVFGGKTDLDERRALGNTFIKDMVVGLKQIHSFGVIHQDIKSENLMFNPATGRSKFIDFGLSCILGTGKRVGGIPVFSRDLTWPCGTPGTIITSPPEMHLRDKNKVILPKSDNGLYSHGHLVAHDVWSIGCEILNWFTTPTDWKDVYYAYQFEHRDFTDMFAWIEDREPHAYNVICGLLDRDPLKRIDNFEKIYNYYTSFSGSLPQFRNTWDDIETSKKATDNLEGWRCIVIEAPSMDADFLDPEDQLEDFGVTQAMCKKRGQKDQATDMALDTEADLLTFDDTSPISGPSRTRGISPAVTEKAPSWWSKWF